MATNERVALITGASSGIGYATALAFARDGTHVVALARRVERLDELRQAVDGLPAPHGNCLAVAADVRVFDPLQAAVDEALATYGRLDVLVANAGLGHRGSVVEAEWDDIETLLRTNMDGVLHSVRAAVPAIRQGGKGGHIVVVSSVVYNMVSPYAALYAASKAFASSLSRSLALELEPDGIQVTDVLVGRTQSEFNDKRLGKAGRTGGGIPVMPTEKVANGIVALTRKRRRTVTLRWFDRLIVLGNLLLPDFIGRRAMQQYK
jgi:short-subunit dehydrogenase